MGEKSRRKFFFSSRSFLLPMGDHAAGGSA